MTSVVKRKNNQRMRWMFIGFGFLMLLYAFQYLNLAGPL